MKQNVLIIGAGLTGALCASTLQRQIPEASIKVWDKARGVGGRMTTAKSPNQSSCTADLGAQYVSISNFNMEKYSNVYNLLIQEKHLEPISAKVVGMRPAENLTHWVAPQGMSSVVKRLLSDLPPNAVQLNRKVESISIDNDSSINVEITSGEQQAFDIVVSTIPVPQFIALKGSDSLLYGDIEEKLKKIKYTTRFVLIYFYDNVVDLPEADWGAMYLQHKVFRYVSQENIKRNSNGETAVVFHTSVDYGCNNLNRSKDDVVKELEASARELFPEWPVPASIRCHKWLYSQVENGYPEKVECLVLNRKPLLILAGDAFTESNVAGCIASANAAAAAILSDKC